MQTEQNVNTGSTGSLGLEHRSFDRYYINYPHGVIQDITPVARLVELAGSALERRRGGVTRCVGRALVTDTVLEEILGTEHLATTIEAAVPTGVHIQSASGENREVWMILGALNHASRASIYITEEMAGEVAASRNNHKKSPFERIHEARSDGYIFVPYIQAEHVDEVVGMWGPTFGWKREGVEALQVRLGEELEQKPENRAVWYSGLLDKDGHLAAVATGERLDMPIGDGRFLSVVESTEWRRSDGISRHGLMSATVSHLHAQIFRDLASENPLIIAETNFRSRAHNVGFAAGMDVPPRIIEGSPVYQTLIQNVSVGDGLTPEGLRDFTMMYISDTARDTLYSPLLCAAMLQEGNI